MKNRYAQVWFMVEDVLDYFPSMTRKQAAKWLERNEGHLQTIMREVGYQFIAKEGNSHG